MKHRVFTAAITMFAFALCLQGVVPAYGAEQTGDKTTPAAQQTAPEGMMHGGQMMGRMMGPPPGPCMMRRGMGPMGHGGPPMMLMRPSPGMGMGMDMMGMYTDPKTRGQMMEIRGRMLQEMGKLMEERGKEIAAGKK